MSLNSISLRRLAAGIGTALAAALPMSASADMSGKTVSG